MGDHLAIGDVRILLQPLRQPVGVLHHTGDKEHGPLFLGLQGDIDDSVLLYLDLPHCSLLELLEELAVGHLLHTGPGNHGHNQHIQEKNCHHRQNVIEDQRFFWGFYVIHLVITSRFLRQGKAPTFKYL